jgi:hypothetical protein
MSRFLKPDVVRINLTRGDWIVIHRQLNLGQERRAQAKGIKRAVIGQDIEIDLEKTGISTTAEYLVDWSFTDHTGQPVVIRDKPIDLVIDILSNLPSEDYTEIADAIAEHQAVIAEEKKSLTTASGS